MSNHTQKRANTYTSPATHGHKGGGTTNAHAGAQPSGDRPTPTRVHPSGGEQDTMVAPTAMLSGVECETCETSRHSTIAPSRARHAAPSPMLMQLTGPPLRRPPNRVRGQTIRVRQPRPRSQWGHTPPNFICDTKHPASAERSEGPGLAVGCGGKKTSEISKKQKRKKHHAIAPKSPRASSCFYQSG
jgi:hypothetical protein